MSKTLSKSKMKRVGILTSGGDSPGMNCVINAAYRAIRYMNYKNDKARERNANDSELRNWELVLIKNGYQGLCNGEIYEINEEWKKLITLNNKNGGTIIGSSRFEEFKNENVRLNAKKILDDNGVESLIAIGGDGTFKGLLKLSDLGIQCIGIPATIDNDVRTSDHTVGFDTALNTVVRALDNLRDTSESHSRISLIEVMGNKCGDLAIYAGPSADIISTTEFKIEENDLIENIRDLRNHLKLNSIIVLVTEKLYDLNKLAEKIQTTLGIETRATILGSVQRGGNPSAYDRYLATIMGRVAVQQLKKSNTSFIIGLKEDKIQALPIPDALSYEEKNRRQDSTYNINQINKVKKLLSLSGIIYKEEKGIY